MVSFENSLLQLAERDRPEALDFMLRCTERAIAEALDEEFEAVQLARQFLEGTTTAERCGEAALEVLQIATMYDDRGQDREAACAWAAYHASEAMREENQGNVNHILKAVTCAAHSAAKPDKERRWQHSQLRLLLPAEPLGFRYRISDLAGRLGSHLQHSITVLRR
jgi:hypothetical protein